MSFNRVVVTRYRIALEQRRYAPATINLRLAAVRRLAYEASDCGLLSPDLAAGIRRVKGAKLLGVRVGNWLSAEQGKKLIASPSGPELRAVRNRAVLAMLIGCGLRRAEVVTVAVEDFELREDHWVLADCGFGTVAPHDLRRTCARLCHQAGGELEQIQFLLGHVSVQTTERYLGCSNGSGTPSTTVSGWNQTLPDGVTPPCATSRDQPGPRSSGNN